MYEIIFPAEPGGRKQTEDCRDKTRINSRFVLFVQSSSTRKIKLLKRTQTLSSLKCSLCSALYLPTVKEGNVFTGVCRSGHNPPHGYWFTAHPCYGMVGMHPTGMLSCYCSEIKCTHLRWASGYNEQIFLHHNHWQQCLEVQLGWAVSFTCFYYALSTSELLLYLSSVVAKMKRGLVW